MLNDYKNGEEQKKTHLKIGIITITPKKLNNNLRFENLNCFPV